MNFGTRMKGFDGSDMGGLADLGRNMTAAAQGIYIAMYGGENTVGSNYELDAEESLTQINLDDFSKVSAGVRLLTTAMGISAPMPQAQGASSGNSLNYDINNNGQVVVLPAMSSSNGTAPLQQLKAASAEMNASNGSVTVIAPTDNSIKNSSSATHIIDLEAAARQSAIDAFMLQQSAQ